jgi:hypothetical protein
MFRVRRAYWSGCAILQVSEGERWVDADVTPSLEAGFSIVNTEMLRKLSARVEQAERRAATARRGRIRKKLPVLVTQLSAEESQRYFAVTEPGVHP